MIGLSDTFTLRFSEEWGNSSIYIKGFNVSPKTVKEELEKLSIFLTQKNHVTKLVSTKNNSYLLSVTTKLKEDFEKLEKDLKLYDKPEQSLEDWKKETQSIKAIKSPDLINYKSNLDLNIDFTVGTITKLLENHRHLDQVIATFSQSR